MISKVEANGVELAYVEEGSGEPLVLVHGSLIDYRYSQPLLKALAGRYRVINYSRRCHWPNPCPPGSPYSFQLHADDLAGLIRALNLGPVHVVGHSYGGAVALLLARQHQELVRSLVLVEPGIYTMMPTTDRGRVVMGKMAAAGERVRQSLAHEMDEEAVRQAADSVLGQGAFDRLPLALRAQLLENAPSLRAAVVAAGGPAASFSGPAASFICDDARKLQMPVLLLEGENTAPQFQLVNGELARCLPNAQRIAIPGANHNLFHEQAQSVANAVLEFIAPPREANAP